MKSYGLAALAPLAITPPSPPSEGKGGVDELGRGTKAIATANLQIELPGFDPKNLPELAKDFSQFSLRTGQQHANIKTNRTLIKKSYMQKFLQRHVKTAISKSCNWGTSLKDWRRCALSMRRT